MIHLGPVTPAAEEGWWALFDLAGQGVDDWILVGGQMMQLLAAEHGVIGKVRPTDDVDVVVNVRTRPGGTEWLASWLLGQGFVFEGLNGEGIGHRFARAAGGGPGTTIFDVLAPEGLGDASIMTMPPARTVQVPGATQAFERSSVREVTVRGMVGRGERAGIVRCPELLGGLVLKAAATEIAVRENPDRDWQDAALLLSMIEDPIDVNAACGRKDRQRISRIAALLDRGHVGWQALDDGDFARGSTALAFVLGD